MPHRNSDFELPRLILCEGRDDIAFFRRMIELRGLPNYHIRDTSEKKGYRAGNTKFKTSLEGLELNSGYRKLRKIVVVSDCDENPNESFNFVREQVYQAFNINCGLDAPLQITETPSGINISIAMIPAENQVGNLESFCIDAARSSNPELAAFTDNYKHRTGAEHWDNTCRKDEMWLRSNLAAQNEDHPFVPLGSVFKNYPDLIPLSHNSFDEIATHLQAIG
jgi:hypothetical protein